jgi:hypothetical protein
VYAWLVSLAWPERPPPAARQPGVSDRGALLRFGLAVGTAGAVCAAIGFIACLEHVGWAPAAALLVMRPSADMQRLRSIGRVASVVAGALAGIVCIEARMSSAPFRGIYKDGRTQEVEADTHGRHGDRYVFTMTATRSLASRPTWLRASRTRTCRRLQSLRPRWARFSFSFSVEIHDMDKAATDRIKQQVSAAFPEGVITRVQVLQYGDDPEVEPAQAAMRVFFDWPGRSEDKKADPKTVHAFCVANATALDLLRDELPRVIRWVEFRPESPAGSTSPHSLAYRITDRGRRAGAPDDVPEDFTPVMVRLGPAELAILDSLITAGIVNSRAEGLRWALNRIREHPSLRPAP